MKNRRTAVKCSKPLLKFSVWSCKSTSFPKKAFVFEVATLPEACDSCFYIPRRIVPTKFPTQIIARKLLLTAVQFQLFLGHNLRSRKRCLDVWWFCPDFYLPPFKHCQEATKRGCPSNMKKFVGFVDCFWIASLSSNWTKLFNQWLHLKLSGLKAQLARLLKICANSTGIYFIYWKC